MYLYILGFYKVLSRKYKVKLVKVHLTCQSQLDRLRKTVFECMYSKTHYHARHREMKRRNSLKLA